MLELRRVLERKRIDAETAGAVVDELIEGAWLDDAAYAQRFAEDRRRLDGWGSERIERKLLSLGVDREDVAAALRGDGGEDHDELGAAVELLRRRFPEPPQTLRDRDRALGMLMRKGYALELCHDALRRHAGVGEFDD